MLERAVLSLGTLRVIVKVALTAGSSQQGKQRLAEAASNCVTAIHRSLPSLLYTTHILTTYSSYWHLFIVMYCIEEMYRKGRELVVVAIDFEKAFDSVGRVALVH